MPDLSVSQKTEVVDSLCEALAELSRLESVLATATKQVQSPNCKLTQSGLDMLRAFKQTVEEHPYLTDQRPRIQSTT